MNRKIEESIPTINPQENPRNIDNLRKYRNITDAQKIEHFALDRVKRYRDLITGDNAPIDPKDFANFYNIEIIDTNIIDNNQSLLGLLDIDEKLKAQIHVKNNDKKVIAYESIFYIINHQELRTITSPGLVDFYNENIENNIDEQDTISKICHKVVREMLMPEEQFRKEYKALLKPVPEYKEILGQYFGIDNPSDIDKKLQDLGL